ncbi:MAG: hypothetical protein ACPHET_04695 [Miltoncostaeaceae bacterium]
MDPDRLMPLTDAARLARCSRKSLERRVERGSLPADLDADGRRAVRAVDLLRAGLVSLAPARSQAGVDPREVADAVSEARAMQAALDATERDGCRGQSGRGRGGSEPAGARRGAR